LANRPDPLNDVGPAKPGRPRSFTAWPLLVLLPALEACWFAWFLAEALPNARSAGLTISRGLILAYTVPGVVPGVTFHESYFGQAFEGFRHVENLPQRAPIALAAALIAGAAIGLGLLALRAPGLACELRPAERLPLAFLLGTVGLGTGTLILGRLGLLAPWPVRVGLGLLAVAGPALEWFGKGPGGPPVPAEDPPARHLRPSLGFALVAGPFLAAMALGAMLPTIDFDSLEYHLQGPKEYFQAGRVGFLPHNVYTSMPSGVEMLHLLGMEVTGDWWLGGLVGQLLVMFHAPAAAAMIALTARRLGSPRAAWIAAVAYLTTPWIYRIATIPYVEGPLCAYHAALIWVAVAYFRPLSSSFSLPRSSPPLWGVAGLLAGGAMACKYPALISAVAPFGVLAAAAGRRRRSWAIPLAFAAGAAVAVGPWLAKNVADTGNPVYPLAYRVFGGRHWDPARDAKWSAAHGPKPIAASELAKSLVDVAGRSDWQSPLFVALAPLALLRRGSRRPALALTAYAAYLFATWWLLTHRLDRFWLPMLPALAVLAGLGADWSRRWAWTLTLTLMLAPTLLANFAYDASALAGLNKWTDGLPYLRRHIPEIVNPPLAALDAALPPTARVLLVGQASVFHVQHPIIYNTVFNDETIEALARGRTPGQLRDELGRLGVTHVYVDWSEIARYRSPGNYGFTPFVTPEFFAGLVRAGVLGAPRPWGPRQQLFRVNPAAPPPDSARTIPPFRG